MIKSGQRACKDFLIAAEALEARTHLSAVLPTMLPGIITRAAVPAGSIQGYTPAQIRKAYGFDQITIGGGAVAADGTGQTIAIVDPFNDPNVIGDLNVFDQQFGIAAPPAFTVVNSTGGSQLPRTDGGWAGEIATDVEWAHAIAPQAKLVLVEAASDGTDDLMTAVNYARSIAGVSVMSLSWGGGEFSGQTSYDHDFSTPTGHQGITFVAAAGDNGAAGRAQWPADAAGVVSVGGTTLVTADASGTYGSETTWTDSSGGYSKYEPEPAWQQVVQRSGARSMPDVAYYADTGTGLALYDSVPYQGVTGWQITDGTSVGAPQWAALVAIANEARTLAGQGTLDGPTQTLPLLYSLYGAPGTAAYANYTSYFNDIVIAQDPTSVRDQPSAGYDIITGLGSPKAAALAGALINAPSAATLATIQQPLASQFTAAFSKTPPTSVIAGTSAILKLKLTNISTKSFSGPVTITLYAAVGTALASDPSSSLLATLSPGQLGIHGHGSKTVTLKFTNPASFPTGDYHLIASVAATGTANTAAQVIAPSTTHIGPPYIGLSPSFAGAGAVVIKSVKSTKASLVIRNVGNISATGFVSVNLYASSDQTFDPADSLLTMVASHSINLRPGRTLTLRLSFPPPADRVAGMFYLIATVTSSVGTVLGDAVVATKP